MDFGVCKWKLNWLYLNVVTLTVPVEIAARALFFARFSFKTQNVDEPESYAVTFALPTPNGREFKFR